jgi:hypothetical protein
MKYTDNIESIIKNFYLRKKSAVKTTEELDKRIINDALPAQEKLEKAQSAAVPPNIWRIIMKSRITKLATAAAILVAGLYVLVDNSESTAWAIEQSIEELKKYNGIYMRGVWYQGDGPAVPLSMWARAGRAQLVSSDAKVEYGNTMELRKKNTYYTYYYNRDSNTVRIVHGSIVEVSPWPGSKLFEVMKRITAGWKESYDVEPTTGRKRVFVTCSLPETYEGPLSWLVEFDTETKLLVSLKQWNNQYHAGKPIIEFEEIVYYEELTDDLFEFEIPTGAKIKEKDADWLAMLNDPNEGMATDNLTEEQACREIVRRYWQAVMAEDWELVAKLQPRAKEGQKNILSKIEPEKIIEIGRPYRHKDCKIGTITPVIVKFKDGDVQEINMIVKFREMNGKASCIIAMTRGAE